MYSSVLFPVSLIFHQGWDFLDADLSYSLCCLGFLMPAFTNKDWSDKILKELNLFHVFCHQSPTVQLCPSFYLAFLFLPMCCPCIHLWKVHFLHLSFAWLLLFIYASFLASLLDFSLIEVNCSWAWGRWFSFMTSWLKAKVIIVLCRVYCDFFNATESRKMDR